MRLTQPDTKTKLVKRDLFLFAVNSLNTRLKATQVRGLLSLIVVSKGEGEKEICPLLGCVG